MKTEFQELASLRSENHALREILSKVALSLGAAATPSCSLEFWAFLPEEAWKALEAAKESRVP